MRIFDKNIFWESVKRSKYIMLLHAVALFVVTTLPAYMERRRYDEELLNALEYPRTVSAIGSTLSGNSAVVFWLMVVAVSVTVISNFSYLFKMNSMQFVSSMPYKRETVYISKAAASLVSVIIPAVGIFGINMLLYQWGMGLLYQKGVTELFPVVGAVLLSYVVMVCVILFAVSVSSNSLATVFTAAFTCLWHYATLLMVYICCYEWFENFVIAPNDSIVTLFPPAILCELWEDTKEYHLLFVIMSVLYIVVLFSVGLVYFKARRSENSNKFFAFDKLGSFFKYYVAIIAALGFGSVFGSDVIPVWMRLMFIGVIFFLMHSVLQAIFEKNMRSLFKNLKKTLAVTTGLVVIIAPFACGFIEPRIAPVLLTSVEIENSDFDMVLNSRDNIKQMTEYMKTRGEGDVELFYRAETIIPFTIMEEYAYSFSNDKYEDFMAAITSSEEYIDHIEKRLDERGNIEIDTVYGSRDCYDGEEIDEFLECAPLLIEEMRKYDYEAKKDSGLYGIIDNKQGDLRIRIYNCYEKFIEKLEPILNKRAEDREIVYVTAEFGGYSWLQDEQYIKFKVYESRDEDIIEKFKAVYEGCFIETTQPVSITLHKNYTYEELMRFSAMSSFLPYDGICCNYYDLSREVRDIINPENLSYWEWVEKVKEENKLTVEELEEIREEFIMLQ